MTAANRPRTSRGSVTTTRRAATTIDLLGGVIAESHGAVVITRDEAKQLREFYGYAPEENELMEAAAIRNMFRDAEVDGLRLIAYLAQYMDLGDDPVRWVAEILSEAGFDCEIDSED